MKKMSFKKILLLCILLLLSCITVKHYYLKAYWKEKSTPHLNPHPEYYFTIKGYVDPVFNGKAFLLYEMDYSTTANVCFHVYNSISGLPEGYGVQDYYWVTPDASGHYEVKIPLDKYLPGYCGWMPYNGGYRLLPHKKVDFTYAFIDIDNDGSEALNPGLINYTCKVNKLEDCSLYINDNRQSFTTLHYNQSYTVTTNFFAVAIKGHENVNHK